MSIDAINAINTNASANVLDASKAHLLDQQNKLQASIKLAASKHLEAAQEDATVLEVSQALLDERRVQADQSLRQSTDASNASAVAEADRSAVANDLARLNELAAQSASYSLSQADRQNIQQEADAIKADLDRIADATQSSRAAAADEAASSAAIEQTAASTDIQNTDAAQASATSDDTVPTPLGVSVFA